MPKGVGKVMSSPRRIWPYAINPQPDNENKQEIWARGRTIGGSSAINGMMYVRGQPADYEELARIAGPEWDWAHIGEAYRQIESHELGPSTTRGDSGPLHLTMPPIRTALTDAMIAAGREMGLPIKQDINDPDNGEAVGYAPRTIYRGRRESAAIAFIRPIASRTNLRIETGIVVDKLYFDKGRCVAVIGTKGGQPVRYECKREVLLAAGALSSPAILQRSGVGPAALLRQFDIPLIAESPDVGSNLREHRALVMQWRTTDGSLNRDHRGWRLIANVARYYADRTGLLAAATYEVGAWLKTRPEFERPDAQLLLAPYSFDFTAMKPAVEALGGMHVCAYILRPESSGTLHIRSTNSTDLPVIQPNYRGKESDRRKMIDLVRYVRDYVGQPALAPYVESETRPGGDFATDDEIIRAYDRFGSGGYHASGTCRMGRDVESVVNERACVRGVQGLRVVDTSILPFLVAGNTNGPAMVMAWRIADMIMSEL
jgi:choline dehydrogenase